MKHRKSKIVLSGTIFLTIVTLFVVIQALSGLYPFGNELNMLWDQDIQYVDFFAFFREVLLGEASLSYSFSKSAGGSLIVLLGYYLGCPLNLFVVFFQNDQLPLFLFLLTAVKLGLAGVTAEIFMCNRFPGLSRYMSVLIAVSYGLMQYNILQMSNIMWLDGVILLPLLLLAVYRFVNEGKRAGLFVMVLISISMNWYTGYMTGIFAVCYFLYERFLKSEKLDRHEWKRIFLDTVKCVGIMAIGVLGSCAIFYPVVKGLQKGKAAFDLSIFYPTTYGSFVDVFRGFGIGSHFSTVSLYCGLLFFLFFIYYFFSGRVKRKEKILSLIAITFMFASCWFFPLDCIWSGFRIVGSYPFRYSFVVIFLVLYLAARGAEEYEKRLDAKKMTVICGGCVLLFLAFHFKEPYGLKQFWMTLIVVVVYAVLFLLSKYKRLFGVLVPLVLAVELVLNGAWTFQGIYVYDPEITDYTDYVNEAGEQIAEIKRQDDTPFYRMDTFQKRYDEESGCSAYLNEAMVQGYWGLNHYSSAHDKNISDMLWEIGYSTDQTVSIVSESILPADSLFGLKYALSKRDVQGYEKIETIEDANGKLVYYNPYALGIGISASDKVSDPIEAEDPFQYQNQLYSNILGREVELFKQIEPEISLKDDTLSFQLPQLGDNDLIYGYVDSAVENLVLNVDGEYRCNYASWLGYKVFGAGAGEEEHLVTLDQFVGNVEDMKAYFFALDLDIFEAVIQELKSHELELEEFKDGYLSGICKVEEEEDLLLTIPYDEGWTVTVNGKAAEMREGADALTVISLDAGENRIEMTYHVPGVKVGIALSILGFVLFWAIQTSFLMKIHVRLVQSKKNRGRKVIKRESEQK